jgi:hypothetical protein
MKIVDNGALLSFNALVFSMRALIAEATELENAVRELLQVCTTSCSNTLVNCKRPGFLALL